MKKNTITPFSFLWNIIKPYKFYFIIMYSVPIANGLYPILYNYAIKLLIDLFSKDIDVTFSQSIIPIMWFLSAQIILDGAWRIHNLAAIKSIPYVFEDIMLKTCHHCFHLPFIYYQNTLSGSIVSKIKGIGDKFFKIHQNLEWKLSAPILVTLFSGIALAKTNYKIFLFIMGFTLIYSPLAFYFFRNLAKIEGKKQDAWYHLFGNVADKITNIMTIFSFAKRSLELQKIKNDYTKILNPLAIRYLKYDFWISLILCLIYWVFIVGLFIYVIELRNAHEISIGDIAYVMALTFAFSENSWKSTMHIKDFLEDIAAFKSAFTIMQQEKCTIDNPDAHDLTVTSGNIAFKELCFNYSNGENVLTSLT
jgi:ATP-binding cassette subfamily B protein